MSGWDVLFAWLFVFVGMPLMFAVGVALTDWEQTWGVGRKETERYPGPSEKKGGLF